MRWCGTWAVAWSGCTYTPGAEYDGPDRDAYDVAHRFPFGYRELLPYYEWVEATLPVQTAAMGTKEAIFFRGCEGVGLPVNATQCASQR